MLDLVTHRDAIQAAVPRWLRGVNAYKLLYTGGLILDGIAHAMMLGIQACAPSFDRDSWSRVCRDRRVQRGPDELQSSLTDKCLTYLYWHQRRGNAEALLRQLRYAMSPVNVVLRVVQNDGSYTELATDGTITSGTQTWNWDGAASQWGRFWVLVHAQGWLTNEGAFGSSGVFGDGSAIGSTVDPALLGALQAVVKAWKPAHAVCNSMIAILDETAWAAALPNGTWNIPANRNPAANYWSGAQ